MLEGLLNIAFFVLVILGMTAGVGIAVVMALVGKKKIKPIVWTGMCALGMVLMVLSPLAMGVLQRIGGWYGGMSLGSVIWNFADVVVYLCAAAFMMCVVGKKKPIAVLLLIPIVLYVAAMNVDTLISNLKYGNSIFGSVFDTLRYNVFELLWLLSIVLLAVWYLTGRNKVVAVITTLMTVLFLVIGIIRGIRFGTSVWLYNGMDYSTLRTFLRDLGYMKDVAWRPLVFAFMAGWSVPRCILSVQVVQACILSGKFGGAEDKKVPVSNKVTKPVAETTAAGKMSSKFCPNCGVRLPEGSAFCNMCGSKIG